ncbi:Pkinase-domain-containing protein [Apiospora saccharicola]|uniref:Pkinase-domain-containing protein n=1 Tax=Apiospora saccharicola TaxID=335842 RepID=A0ABR1WJC7_9PEZI
MQTSKARAEALGRKAKLANSYQELLDEFSDADLKNVGNYGLGKLIGKGSFGKVYLATHKLTNGSKVVLKSAKKDDSNLAREIHHHRQFVHPHIARLYEVIVTESLVWLVLEYCPGDELYNYLLKHGPLPVEKVQKTFTQLVGAVCYVHQQSCVHRDLKLENILLDKHENVKLVDFGFTREYEGKSNYLQTFCGTICYSAPEMLKGEKYAGEKVDVWSLGVILYALLCGELPFDDDDDNVTRKQILSEEPKYPEHLTADAVSLIKLLLSKRPLLRPTLPDILQHPFLLEHAPQQQAILKLHQPAPFTTALEKECLHRMRGAGVDIDQVIESVLSQRCDALAGWWTLLLEKEERKAKRRERRRKEKEAENRSSRRFSAASSKLDRMAPIMDEDGVFRLGDPPCHEVEGEQRGELPNLPESYAKGSFSPDSDVPPPPLEKDSIRSTSTSLQRRPVPPPKEGILRSARSRGSTLHLVTAPDVLGINNNGNDKSQQEPQQKMRKKPSQAIIQHWKTWKHWIVDTTRRHTPSKRPSLSTPNLNGKTGNKNQKDVSPRPHTSKNTSYGNGEAETTIETAQTNGHVTRSAGSNRDGGNITTPTMLTHTHTNSGHMRQRVPSSASSYKRLSISPAPITPRSTVRRPSGGLRGRKSTSSSLSSIHTMPRHQHTHSKASSTSSTASMSTTKTPLATGRSPHHSVKVLPATPTSSAFPSNIRLVRGPTLSLNFNEGMPSGNQNPPLGSPNPFAGQNILFAKRKKNLFKGPMLSLGNQGGGSRSRETSHSRNTSANGLGRRSGEMAIQEEDEEAETEAELQSRGYGEQREMDEESIEEVEQFSPIIRVPGESVEEIYEEDGAEADSAADYFFTPVSEPEKLTIPSAVTPAAV